VSDQRHAVIAFDNPYRPGYCHGHSQIDSRYRVVSCARRVSFHLASGHEVPVWVSSSSGLTQ
jgi:hypothetical protein